MHPARRFVYVIGTEQEPVRYCTGLTADVDRRLIAHNNGQCPTSASGRPWTLDVVVRCADELRAMRFERYLKSGSVAAFAKWHLK